VFSCSSIVQQLFTCRLGWLDQVGLLVALGSRLGNNKGNIIGFNKTIPFYNEYQIILVVPPSLGTTTLQHH
jgi:hypothetical protein